MIIVLAPSVVRGFDVVVELVRSAIGLEQVDSRVEQRKNHGAVAMTRDVLPAPAEIDALTLGREQNLRELHHQGAAVDMVVVVIGHAILPTLSRRQIRRQDRRSVYHLTTGLDRAL